MLAGGWVQQAQTFRSAMVNGGFSVGARSFSVTPGGSRSFLTAAAGAFGGGEAAERVTTGIHWRATLVGKKKVQERIFRKPLFFFFATVRYWIDERHKEKGAGNEESGIIATSFAT